MIKPNILFINPPYESLKGFNSQSFSSGLLYLATTLSAQGYRARVYDADNRFEKNSYIYSNINRVKMHKDYMKNLYDDDHMVWKQLAELLNHSNST